MNGVCLPLTIFGGVFEVAGFALVAWEIARLQRQEFGTPVWFLRLRGRIQRLLRRRVTHTVSLGAAVGGSASLRGRARVRQTAGDTAEQRISALEVNFEHLEREIDERWKEVESDLSEVRASLTRMRGELDQQQQEREVLRKEFLRTSVVLQTTGTGLFVLGAILSVLGNTVSC